LNERLKKLRKTLDLTQQEFADKIGSKRNTIAKYETGVNTPSTAVISLICREFNVCEEWLRTGNGEMFLPSNREDEISKMVKKLLNNESNTFKSRFITMLANLSDSDWERLEIEARKLLNNKDSDILATLSESKKVTVEEAEAEYIKSRLEVAQQTKHSALNTTISDTENNDKSEAG